MADTATLTQQATQTADQIAPILIAGEQPVSVQQFMKDNGFTQVARKVRASLNGYPFITFINAANQAENIYFSKRASATVAEGDEIAKGFFDNYRVRMTVNADSEARVKLVSVGEEGGRLDAADLF